MDEALYVAFRGGLKSVRDPFLLKGPLDAERFTCTPISTDDWVTTCPMMGIPFRVDDRGRILVSWMSDHKAYFALADEKGVFGRKIAAPASQLAQEYPMALSNRKGETILLWTQGNQILYADYTKAGKATGQARVAGRLTGHLKPTAFVDQRGDFVIVY